MLGWCPPGAEEALGVVLQQSWLCGQMLGRMSCREGCVRGCQAGGGAGDGQEGGIQVSWRKCRQNKQKAFNFFFPFKKIFLLLF